MELIDANVLIRVVVRDQPDHAVRARRFLNDVGAGVQTATVTESALVEVVHVLSSKRLYNRPRAEIRAFLDDVLDLRGLSVSQEGLFRRALELYAEALIDFVDALNVSHVERAQLDGIVTFDLHYNRITSVSSREP